jgi:hypothetical protein
VVSGPETAGEQPKLRITVRTEAERARLGSAFTEAERAAIQVEIEAGRVRLVRPWLRSLDSWGRAAPEAEDAAPAIEDASNPLAAARQRGGRRAGETTRSRYSMLKESASLVAAE